MLIKQQLYFFIGFTRKSYFISLARLFLVSYFLFPNFALAQLPSGRVIKLRDLYFMIEDISVFLIRTSAVLAVIFIVWSGITYMYAGEDTAKVTSAQNRLKSGIIGAAIIFGVGVILQTIVGVVTGEFFCQGVWIPITGTCI